MSFEQGLEQVLWHPVLTSTALGVDPMSVTLLGHRLVLWRDETGQAHAWADACPHRGARLSLGHVSTGTCGARHLVCPYHGWQFGPGGQCRLVPAQPEWTPPASHAARAHEVKVAHGLLWVRLEPPPTTGSGPQTLDGVLRDPPPFEPASRTGWRTLLCGPYAVSTSAPRLVENFLDMSHFGFVHKGWLGDPLQAQVNVGQVDESASGVYARHCEAWQPRAYAGADHGQHVAYRYAVEAPFSAVLQKDATAPDGPSNAIALFINPTEPEACVAWFVMATHNDPSTDDELRSFQDAVFAQDRPVVESQTPLRLPLLPAAKDRLKGQTTGEVHGPADRLSAAYRRYLARLGVRFGVC